MRFHLALAAFVLGLAPAFSGEPVALKIEAPAAPIPTLAAPAAIVSPPAVLGAAAVSPAERMDALSQNLSPVLAAARNADVSNAAAYSAGGQIIRALTGEVAAASSDDANFKPAEPDYGSYDVLGKLGARETILKNGGLTRRADGTIAPVAEAIRMSAFDNDDNAVYYRTKIYVRHKQTGEERAITTSEFAEVRPEIGKSGKYREFQYFDDAEGGSFRDFRDVKDPEIFIKDLRDAITREAGSWRGPSWFKFATALKDERAAPWVAIVTSRGHRPENVVRGFSELQAKGYLKAVPRAELIFGMSSPDLAKILPDNLNTPQRKLEVIVELLDLLESIPLADPGARHSFGFSDDDVDMSRIVREGLSRLQLGQGRWPRVKISLFSTGLGTESMTTLSAPR